MQQTNSRVLQIAAINKIIEVRRFRIKENLDYILSDKGVVSLVKEIKDNIHLDVFQLDSKKDYEQYEKYLQQLLRQQLSVGEGAAFIDEEIKLIDNCNYYPVSNYVPYSQITIQPAFRKTDYIEKLLNTPELNSLLRKPELIESIHGDRLKDVNTNFLLKIKFVYRLRPVYAVIHLAEDGRGVSKGIIQSCFYFDAFAANLSPSRMFLRALNKYGIEGYAGDKAGKFIFEHITSPLSIDRDSINTISLRKSKTRQSLFLVQTKRRPEGGTQFFMAYGMNETLMRSDIAKSVLL